MFILEDCFCFIKIILDNYNCCWNVFVFCFFKFFNKLFGKEIIDSIVNDFKFFEFLLFLFFFNICICIEIKGWVDIEKEYYDLL